MGEVLGRKYQVLCTKAQEQMMEDRRRQLTDKVSVIQSLRLRLPESRGLDLEGPQCSVLDPDTHNQ